MAGEKASAMARGRANRGKRVPRKGRTQARVPGMGTPFAMISNKSLLIIGSNRFYDDDLELNFNLLFNLEDAGQLLGLNLEYLLNDNWFIDVSISYFIGNGDPINRFEQFEDFSNTQFQLSYSF